MQARYMQARSTALAVAAGRNSSLSLDHLHYPSLQQVVVPKEAALFDLLVHSPALARGVYTLRAPLEWGRSMYNDTTTASSSDSSSAAIVCGAPQSIVAAAPETGCSSSQEVGSFSCNCNCNSLHLLIKSC
jgi:hypothetical protein